MKILCDAKFQRDCEEQHGDYGSKQFIAWERFKACVKHAKGYLELNASLAYRSWFLGQTSCAIAAELGMAPATVRQILNRLVDIGRVLGFEAPLRKHANPDRRAARDKNTRRYGQKMLARNVKKRTLRIEMSNGNISIKRRLLVPDGTGGWRPAKRHDTRDHRRAQRFGITVGEYRDVWAEHDR